jgi:broad specificity phosphatase PhoE
LEGSTPTLISFLRHARSVYNEQKRWQGHFNSPLSTSGREQLIASLNRLPQYDKIISSDLARAIETAERIAHHQGLIVTCDHRLRERDIGPWAGLTTEQIFERWPVQSITNVHPQSEPISEFSERVSMCFDEFLAELKPKTHILIVTHRGVIEQVANKYEPQSKAPDRDYDALQLAKFDNSVQLSYHSYGIRY